MLTHYAAMHVLTLERYNFSRQGEGLQLSVNSQSCSEHIVVGIRRGGGGGGADVNFAHKMGVVSI